MSISFILSLFLFHLSAGMMMVLPFLPVSKVDRAFLKSVAFWAALFLVMALVAGHLRLAVLAMVGLLVPTLYLWVRLRLTGLPLRLPTVVMVALVGWAAVGGNAWLYQSSAQAIVRCAVVVNFLGGSLLLGSFLVGMLFGHSYLLNTEVPKRLLVTMSWIMLATVVFRFLAVLLTLVLFNFSVFPDTQFLDKMISFAGHGIFFWERVLVGIVIPIAVAIMTWRTALIGSNQSATGIMYVGVAFTLIGELIALYLFILSGIPL